MSTTTSRRLPGAALAALCIAAGALATAWLAPAAATSEAARPAAAPATVAIVDIVKVMNGLAERSDQRDALNARRDQREKLLEEFAKKIEKLKTELDAMPKDDPARRDKLAERYELQEQIKARHGALQQVLLLEEGDIVRSLYLKIADAVRRVSEKNGYDLVLMDDRKIELPEQATANDVNMAIMARRVMHASPSLDITEQVIGLMNNEYAAGVKKQN